MKFYFQMKKKLTEYFHFWLIVSYIFLLLGNKLLGILDDSVKMDYYILQSKSILCRFLEEGTKAST